MSQQPVSWAEAPAREFTKGKLSELLNETAWRLPGSNDLEQRKALEMAADRFCRHTRAWHEPVRMPEYGLWGPMPRFFFGPAAGLLPSGVLTCASASGLGEPLGLVFTGGRAPFPTNPWGFRIGHPCSIFWTLPTAIPPFGFFPMPEAYFTVVPGSDEFPEEILRKWGPAIADGAYGLLATQANRPWSDPPSGQLALNRFNSACVSARAETEPKDLQGQPTCRNPIPFC